jgi:hypothetical protein
MQTATIADAGAELAPFTPAKAHEIMEAVLIRGDLANLDPRERAKYYVRVCESIGLNPMTKPFEYIILNGKLTLYARKDCTDQLRSIHKISVTDIAESERDEVFIVTAKVANAEGRTDAAKGAVNIANLKGDALANALMKAETKAKRRATLSICGLGFLDESEIETIPEVAKVAASHNGVTTLPKKDCRDIYQRLQGEIDGAEAPDALAKWRNDAADRLAVLPVDWQLILSARYEERMAALRQGHDADGVVWDEAGERPATTADVIGGRSQPFLASEAGRRILPLTISHATMMKAVVEPPKAKAPFDHTDIDGIPASLRRQKPVQADLDIRDQRTPPAENAIDPHKWFEEVATAISTCADLGEIQRVQVMQMMPVKKRIPAEIWRLAEGLIGKRMTQIGEQLIAAE